MKILITPDCLGWAIDNITNDIILNNPHIQFFKVPVHPRNVEQSIFEINAILKHGIDLWHAQYWHSAMQLIKMLPELKKIPKILTHHNHYALDKEDWSCFDALTIQTKWGTEKLNTKHSNVYHIAHGVDLNRFNYIKELKGEYIGYIGRVIEHKNLKKICETAGKLGYKVIGSGYIDKPRYWESVPKENLIFNGGIGREQMNTVIAKDNIYAQMKVFVMYSTDEKETGTLPLLEAMAKGIPVLTTVQGSARDLIKDGENGIIFNEENFENKLKMLMEDKELREKIRYNARRTINNYSSLKVAREHEKLYHKVLHKKPLISIIVPTYNRYEQLIQLLLSIELNKYEAKEIIVCDDGSDDLTYQTVIEARKKFKTPIKYIRSDHNGYGLARMRNLGAIEAIGQILLFLDDRFILQEDTLNKVSNNCLLGKWYFGNKLIKEKAGNKSNFVENFSWINKCDFVNGGMFNERIDCYGGMSQEIRQKYSHQRIEFVYKEDIFVKENMHSNSRNKISEIWKAKNILYKMYE
jgi:glycosyltransferase involved in cell wall biosynthesis